MPRIPTGVRTVFFDAVGTLLFPDPPALVVYAEAALRHGLSVSPAAVRERFIVAYRREEDADVAAGWVTSETRERERWRRIVTETLYGVADSAACYAQLFDHFARPDAWRLAPDAAEVLASLRERGFVLGLGSNYDDRLWSVLGGFPELAPVRDRVLISSAVGVRKPGADFFREAARVAGCDVSEVLFVGDDLGNDYAGATAAGMLAVLLDPSGRHPDVAERIGRLAELLGE